MAAPWYTAIDDGMQTSYLPDDPSDMAADPLPLGPIPEDLPQLPLDEWGMAPPSPEPDPEVEATPPELAPMPMTPPSEARTGAFGLEGYDAGLDVPLAPSTRLAPTQAQPAQEARPWEQVYDLGDEQLTPEAIEEAPIDPYYDPLREVDPSEMTPEAFAQRGAQLEQDRMLFAAQRQQELADQRADAAERHAEQQRIRAAQERLAMEEIQRDVEELSRQKLDTGRWWSNRSTGQKAAGYLSAFLSGFMQPLQGGPNQTLELMGQAIDRDLAAQRADIQNGIATLDRKRGLLRQFYDRTGSLDQATYAAKLVALGAAESKVASEAAMLDPEGTRAYNAEKILRTIQAQKAQAAGQFEAARKKEQREQEEHDAKMAKLGAETDKIRGDIRGAGGGGGGIKRDANAKAAALKKYGVNPKDSARYYFVAGYDEPPIEFATAGAREEFTKRMSDSESAVRIIDRILVAQEKYGWEHPIWNSDQGRKMRSQYTSLMMKMKNAWQLGALSKDDIELVDQGLGGTPTQIRSTAASLRAQREMLQDDARIELGRRKYTGSKGFRYPRLADPDDVLWRGDEELGATVSQGYAPGVGPISLGSRKDSVAEIAERYANEPQKGSELLTQQIQKIREDEKSLRKELETAEGPRVAEIQQVLANHKKVSEVMAQEQAKMAARAQKLKARSEGREKYKRAYREAKEERGGQRGGMFD